MDNIEPKYVIKPRFSILYEMIMPTGKKIKKSLLMLLCVIILYIVLIIFKDIIDFDKIISGVNVDLILNTIFIILIIALCVKTAIHIIFQVLQYRHLSFSFYDEYMIYEDSFLNQHRKTIQYSNIKEVEIRRTITDRILGFGIIVIYTNAENSNNGLVIYSIRKPQECYNKIQHILEESKNIRNKISHEQSNEVKNVDNQDEKTSQGEEAIEVSKIVNFSEEDEKNFNDSLKNINN